MPGTKGTSIEQAASNVAADKKMMMRRAMVNSIFLLLAEVNLLQASHWFSRFDSPHKSADRWPAYPWLRVLDDL